MRFDTQEAYDVRVDWGADGMVAIGPGADCVVICDILSFSTCVVAAVERGAEVYPVAWKDQRAELRAQELGAYLAGSRATSRFSLSPLTMAGLEQGDRIVLPSPNGATLSTMTGLTPAITACLRNATAAARVAQTMGRRVAVIAAGERWEGTDRLRFALEDWLGAGAIVAALGGKKSPEALAAEATFLAMKAGLSGVLHNAASGRELIDRQSAGDVAYAAALDASGVVPVLQGGCYVPAALERPR